MPWEHGPHLHQRTPSSMMSQDKCKRHNLYSCSNYFNYFYLLDSYFSFLIFFKMFTSSYFSSCVTIFEIGFLEFLFGIQIHYHNISDYVHVDILLIITVMGEYFFPKISSFISYFLEFFYECFSDFHLYFVFLKQPTCWWFWSLCKRTSHNLLLHHHILRFGKSDAFWKVQVRDMGWYERKRWGLFIFHFWTMITYLVSAW